MFNKLNKKTTRQLLSQWHLDGNITVEPDESDLNLRNRLLEVYSNNESSREYLIDINIGYVLMEYLIKNNASESLYSNFEFWNYIAIKVIPDLCEKRWGLDRIDEHICGKKPTRNWPYSLVWFYKLAWQGDLQSTYNVISNTSRFSTDSIVGIVERVGRKTQYSEVYSKIVKEFYSLDSSTVDDVKKHFGISTVELFRRILCLNTALCSNFDPNLYRGGIDGYIEHLFDECVVVNNREES